MNYKYKKNYSTYSYWEKKIIDDEPIWMGSFNNESITKDSVILYTGMFNEVKDIYKKLEYITEENVLSDELLNRVFIDLLNNNMPVLF